MYHSSCLIVYLVSFSHFVTVRSWVRSATKPQVDHKRLAGSACIPSPWAIYLDALCQDTGGNMDIPQSSQSRFCLGWRRMRRS